MAFSGDKTWALTRNDIINSALRKIGEYDSTEAATSDEIDSASMALNALIKEWSGQGVGLWLRQVTYLMLNRGIHTYQLGSSGGVTGVLDNFHFLSEGQIKENTIKSDETASEVVISIDDTTWDNYLSSGIAKPTSGNIGIRLDDLSIHWSTISAVGADTITINDALPSAASAGNKVYTYINRAPRPRGIVSAYRRSTSGYDSEVRLIGRIEYEQLSTKSSSGPPTAIHYEPNLASYSSGDYNAVLRVWPAKNPKDHDKLVMVTEHYPDDMDSSADNPQFPSEWSNALIWNLALELSFEYTVDTLTRREIKSMAREKKDTLFDMADVENADVIFTMGGEG